MKLLWDFEAAKPSSTSQKTSSSDHLLPPVQQQTSWLSLILQVPAFCPSLHPLSSCFTPKLFTIRKTVRFQESKLANLNWSWVLVVIKSNPWVYTTKCFCHLRLFLLTLHHPPQNLPVVCFFRLRNQVSLGLPLVVRVAETIVSCRPGQVIAIILPLPDNPYTTTLILLSSFCFLLI